MGEGRALVERYFDAVNVMRVVDGRIASLHIYFDQLGFMAQLGLLPG